MTIIENNPTTTTARKGKGSKAEPVKPPATFQLDLTPMFVRHVNAVQVFASKDDARAILTGVLFGRNAEGNLRLVATDSYKLVQLDTCTPVPEFEPFAVRAQDLVDAVKVLGKGAVMFLLAVEWNDSRSLRQVRMTNGADHKLVSLLSGEFPNYRNLIPADSSVGAPMTQVIAFNPDYLASICDAVQALDPKGSHPIRFVGGETAMKPFKMRGVVQDVGVLDAILMPVRVTPPNEPVKRTAPRRRR